MISKKRALEILNIALKTGAEYAEIYQQEEIKRVISVNFKRVDVVSTSLIAGIGLRLIKNGKQVYGYTSDLSLKSLNNLAEQLSSSFEGEQEVFVKELNSPKKKTINEVLKPIEDVSTEVILAKLKLAEKAAYDVSEQIVNCNIAFLGDINNVTVFNSDGVVTSDLRSNVRGIVAVTSMNEKGSYGSHFEGPGAMGGYEKFEAVDLVELAKHSADMAIKKSNAPDSPSGNMTVVLGNAFGGVLFHEACGHPLEACAIATNMSKMAGKLGEKIASDVVTAVDDGTINGAWGSINYDDEGHESTKNVLIKNGVLQNYMVDRFYGKKLGLEATGSERRQSYRFLPTTRMTNTYIAAGKSKPEEVIASVKYGLYLKSFRGGSVDPSTNNFNFSCDEAYIICDGKICELVKPVILVGFGYEILKKIDMVADDLKLAAGNCGSSSGNVYVQVGQPTLRISGITVGGSMKEGEAE